MSKRYKDSKRYVSTVVTGLTVLRDLQDLKGRKGPNRV